MAYWCCSRLGCPTDRASQRRRSTKCVVLLGPKNAGKTTLFKRLTGETAESVVPTTYGFQLAVVRSRPEAVLYDVGGRVPSENYLGFAHGFIFMVDGSDGQSQLDAKGTLRLLQRNSNFADKPLLLLLNKKDLMEVYYEEDEWKEIARRLGGQRVYCSALFDPLPNLEKLLADLLEQVRDRYNELQLRVERDSFEEREREHREMMQDHIALHVRRKRFDQKRQSQTLKLANLAFPLVESRERMPKTSIVAERKIVPESDHLLHPPTVASAFSEPFNRRQRAPLYVTETGGLPSVPPPSGGWSKLKGFFNFKHRRLFPRQANNT